MKINSTEVQLVKELLEEYFYHHPQLQEVLYDDEGVPYEYKNGYIDYNSYGPKKVRELDQLISKLNSFT